MISKSDYIAFRECRKNAWIKIHRPDVFHSVAGPAPWAARLGHPGRLDGEHEQAAQGGQGQHAILLVVQSGGEAGVASPPVP